MANNVSRAVSSLSFGPTSQSVLQRNVLDNIELTPFEEIDPTTYAEWYLHSCYPKVPFHDEKIILDFLVSEAPRVRGAECLLELGCGPVVSHAVPFANYVNSFILSDYLDSNLEMLRMWIEAHPNAHNWGMHTSFIMRREGVRPTPNRIQQRESILKSKIISLVIGDLLSKKPIGESRLFPVVTCFYATEQAASDETEWLGVIQNLGGLVAPGGQLFLACVRNACFYAIHDESKNAMRIPIVPITAKLAEKGLRLGGFSSARSVIESTDVGGLSEEGLDGVILIRAVKSD